MTDPAREALIKIRDFARDPKRMEDWDELRRQIAAGDTGSGPRDVFESILDWFTEEASAALLEAQPPADAERVELAQRLENGEANFGVLLPGDLGKAAQIISSPAGAGKEMVEFWCEVERLRATIEATSRNAEEAKKPELAGMLYRYAKTLQAALKAARPFAQRPMDGEAQENG